MGEKPKIDYNIRCITPSDYELEFTIAAENKTFLLLFNKAKDRLLKTKGMKVGDANPELINEFEVPEYYYKFLKVTLRKIYQDVRKQVKEKQIELMTHDIKNAKFKRNAANDWDITINLMGIYADKR